MIRMFFRVSPLLRRLVSLALILLIVLMLLPVQPARAELIVGSNITESTVWSGEYRVTASVSVVAGVRLVIQPGTIIRFDAGTGIDCYGQMLALGETSNPVVFTSNFNWRGLKFLDDDIVYGPSELWGTIIEMGGQQGGSVMIDNAQVTIANSEIRTGTGDGVIGYANGTAIITNTLITGQLGYALRFHDPGIDPQLAYLRATDNGHNVIALGGGASYLLGDRLWENAGLPYEIFFTGFTVAQGETLTIEPGVTMRFVDSSSLYVAGRLIAAGTPEQPITFSAVNPTPGSWQGINVIGTHDSPAMAVFSHAIIEYGGSGPSGGNLRVEGANVVAEYSRIQHSAAYGAHVGSGGVLKVNASQITDNALGGVKTLRNDIDVIARNNWWGHASGPLHPNTNPGGLGNSVSDNVLYDPWLTDPALGGPGAARPVELQVQVIGNANFVPGSRQTYALAYRNGTANTITNAVLVAWLPDTADYQYSQDGIYWAAREQVFWRLGDLPPGAEGIVALAVEYQWGLPFGMNDSLLAALAGSNAPTDLFLLSDYLTYTPTTITSQHELTQPEIDALLQGNAEAAGRYNAAIVAGYKFTYGITSQRSDGVSITEINLLRPIEPLTFQTIFISASGVTARTINRERYTLEAGQTVLRYDHQALGWQIESPAIGQGINSFTTGMTFAGCMKNCTQEIIKSKIADKAMPVMAIAEKIANCAAAIDDPGNNDDAVLQCAKEIGTKIPGIGDAVDIGTDLGKCNSDCKGDPNSHVCTEDKYECNNKGAWVWLTGPEAIVYTCNTDTGMYFAGTAYKKCKYDAKCVINANGSPSCQDCSSKKSEQLMAARSELRLNPAVSTSLEQPNAMMAGSNQNTSCPFCSPAQDPNAKLGVEGLVAPGQTLEYTVQYENVGAGEAFGVFVMDKLSTVFDETTLVLGEGGKYLPASRTIFWNVGELAVKNRPGSKGEFTFTVRLRADLPTGTVVTNQATVYFPSVPEITPTNAVVNSVQPLVGSDQRVDTLFGHSVSFQLSGFSAAGGTLTYQITQSSSFGTISGSPPNLTFTPMVGYSGPDHLYFTVSNGMETSLPAQVMLNVKAEKIYLPMLVR